MKQFFLSILCAGVLFSACSNDNEDNNKNYQARDFIAENLLKATKTVELQVSDQPQEIVHNGVKVTIPGGNVFTKNGVPITGKYTVKLVTMLKPSDIILSATNTNYRSSAYLESDGFFRISVLKDDQEVDPITGDFLSVSIPTDKEDGALTVIWEGDLNNDKQFAWQEVADTLLDNRGNTDQGWAVSFNKTFNFGFKKLGWFNCDIFWSSTTNNTTVAVNLSGQFGELANYQGYSGDTFVFFKPNTSRVIAQLYTKINNSSVRSYENSIPIATQGTLLAFSIKDGEYSYATKEIEITADLQESLELLPTTKEAVLANLAALDQ